MHIDYAQTPFQVEMQDKGDRAAGTAQVTLGNPLGYAVRYTTDSSEPKATSPAFTTPWDVKLPATVRAAAFADGHALAPASTFELTPASLLSRTDEAMAVERLGLHPALVEGREDNLKVTTPADLALAEFLLARKA